jgi:tetratricopeptide (TPR) repeat protein
MKKLTQFLATLAILGLSIMSATAQQYIEYYNQGVYYHHLWGKQPRELDKAVYEKTEEYYNNAVKYYKKSLDIKPDYTPALYELGVMKYTSWKNREEGLEYIKKAAKLGLSEAQKFLKDLENDERKKIEEEKAAEERRKAAAAERERVESMPRDQYAMQADPATIDLGTIKAGEAEGVVTFTIKNTGKETISVSNDDIRSTCGCIRIQSTQPTNQKVEAGQTLTITAKYDFKKQKGNINKTISVSFGNFERVVLYLKANVIE